MITICAGRTKGCLSVYSFYSPNRSSSRGRTQLGSRRQQHLGPAAHVPRRFSSATNTTAFTVHNANAIRGLVAVRLPGTDGDGKRRERGLARVVAVTERGDRGRRDTAWRRRRRRWPRVPRGYGRRRRRRRLDGDDDVTATKPTAAAAAAPPPTTTGRCAAGAHAPYYIVVLLYTTRVRVSV